MGLMTRIYFYAGILFIFSISTQHTTAQPLSHKPDTSFITIAKKTAKELYFSSIIPESSLNNGGDYAEYDQRDEEHPYFLTDDWATGSVFYDNDYYYDVPLMYDISQQKVISEHYSSASKIALVNKKIRRFTLLDHTFIWIEKGPGTHATMPSGFYDALYDGKTKVVARRQKQLQEQIVSGKLEAEFEENNRYFIYKDNHYFPVKSKGSVIAVLGDQKASIRQFIRKHKLSFHSNREDAMKRIAGFYDSLTD